jgi:hypothetical protein
MSFIPPLFHSIILSSLHPNPRGSKMIDQAILTMVRDVVTIFGVMAGFSYYVLTVRNANRARQTQIFMPIYSNLQGMDFIRKYMDVVYDWEWKDYDDFIEKYGWSTNPEAWSTWTSIANVYYNMGFLMKMKQIDPVYPYETMRTMAITFWERYEPIIKEMRKQVMPRA